MSPELGFALFLTLLWGPTALWLGYRALRGHRSRRSGSFVVATEAVQSSPAGPEAADALLAQGFWVCGACRSVNRRGTTRCYGCKTAMEPLGQPAPSAQPVRPLVPVMAEAVAVPAGGDARTPAPTAASRTNPAALDVLASEPEPVLSAAPREVPAASPVCPYLGFKNDPSTRCDFADPRNFCHAASAHGAAPVASPWRFIPGKVGSTRSQEIGAFQQSSQCLTTAHEWCARYPAAPVVAAS